MALTTARRIDNCPTPIPTTETDKMTNAKWWQMGEMGHFKLAEPQA